jgi:acyl-coenzyme A synthetase/AMP-(fatty) acid ligase
VAVIHPESQCVLTYRELHLRVQRAADELRKYARSLVLFFVNNDVGGVVCYLAALDAGHAVFLSPSGTDQPGVLSLIQMYRPELILWRRAAVPASLEHHYESGGLADEYWVLRRRHQVDEPPHLALAAVLSTSASTGSPKAVRLSAASLTASAVQVADALAVTHTDRSLLSLPLSYVYGLSVLNSTLYVGGALVILKKSLADRAIYTQLASSGVTGMACVAQTFEYMRRLKIDAALLPTLRRLTHSGSSLDPQLFAWIYDHFGRCGTDIYLMYGQTEACGRISVLPPEALPELHRSVGRTMRSGALSISDGGEVVYRGPGVMLGYATCREDLNLGDTLQGVLHTGDLGHLDDRGYLFLTGRLSRHCKVFGQRVNLDDIEVFVGGERQTAAVEKSGHIAIFFEGVAPAASPSLMQLARHFQLPPQSFRLYAVPELPRTNRGKIAYTTLLSML